MFYLFLRARETEREWGWGREREGDTESETGSRLRAPGTEPDVGLELTNRETLNRLSHPGAPIKVLYSQFLRYLLAHSKNHPK